VRTESCYRQRGTVANHKATARCDEQLKVRVEAANSLTRAQVLGAPREATTMYNARELQQLHRAGKAHKLPDGSYVPTSNPAEVAAAIQQAKNADGTGADDDDPGLRQHLIRRAAAFGAERLIPASWARESGSAKALLAQADRMAAEANQFSDLTTARLYFDAARQLRKQAAEMPDAPVSEPGADSRFPALDELAVRAAATRSVSKGLVDVIRSGGIAQLERDVARLRSELASGRVRLNHGFGGPVTRQRSTRSRELMARAARYDQAAGDMTLDRDVRRGYEQLAAKARREASMT
jgi:hypothetical protein